MGADEPRKRLSRLRSVKVTNLDKFRLSMKKTRSRLSQEIVLSEDSMELDSKQKQSPNYMKATSCFNARSGSSQLNPGGMKRRLRKLPSRKSEVSSTASHDNAELDFEGEIEVAAPAKLKLIRSGSIKITRVRSLKLSRRRLPKSRLDQTSNLMPDDESAEELSSDSDLQKTINSSRSAASLKPIRTLYKMPSLRSKRRQQQVKKKSRFSESNAAHFDRATCSSALKSSKIPQTLDLVSGKCGSESELIGHVCPYTYCSLHGHQHSPSPPLKGFIATKRRLLRKQRSIRLKRKPKTEANAFREVSRMNQSMQAHSDSLISETECSNEEMFVEVYANLRDVSTPESSADRCCTSNENEVRDLECDGESGKADADSVESDELYTRSSPPDSADMLLDSRNYASMWKLIYKHLSVPGTGAINEEGERGKDGNADPTDMNEDHRDENQVAGSEKLEFNQAEAIEFVQQAVDEILHLDEQSPLFPISPNIALSHVNMCSNAEVADPAKEDDLRAQNLEDGSPKELKDIKQANSGSTEGKQPVRQRSKGFEKLRKMIITAKFVKAVEKLRRINPRKPRFLSPEALSKLEKVQLRHISMGDGRFLSPEEQSKLEKVQLRHLSMKDGRKNTEEWMLDFALQQVIANLAPAQQKRVGILVEAFERVAPETNIKRKPAKTTPASQSKSTDNVQEEEEISIDNSRSCEIIFQDPERKANLENPVESAEYEDHGDKIVLEVDENRSQPQEFEDSGKQEFKTESHGKDFSSTSINEPENVPFDKEKFTNVWHMVYRQFISEEATHSGEKKVDTKEQDESINSEESGSRLGRIDTKQEVNQADAIRLVQEAIDELLNLHEQLSDQKTPKSCEVPDTQMKEQEREDTENQKALQRQTSKPLSRLRKLVLSAKFIKTMEKLRKIRTCNTEEVSSQESQGEEKICLRRSTTEERRNGEDWMLDNTLQQVISKLAPAQQKRVALLTQAFETFNPELQQISRRYSPTPKQKNEEDKVVVVDRDAPIIHDDSVDKVQVASIESNDNKSQVHDQTNTKVNKDDSQEDEQKDNAPSYVLSEGKYSKMWQMIYQHVKTENQTTVIRAKENQYDDVQTRDATFGKLEITQSNANKLVKEALDGILQQQSPEDKINKENGSRKYSKWKRAIMCTKFVNAMERMQNVYTKKKRSPYNPLISDQEAEIVHLRQCSIDERSNSEVWMLDYALRQAIAKLAPVQQRKVTLLIEAFEKVGPNTEETTSKEQCNEDKALSELTGDGDIQSQDIGKSSNDGGNNIFLDKKKYSSMWRLIYKQIQSGIPKADAEQIPTETDVYGTESDVETPHTLDGETPCDSDWSSTDNEFADQNSPSGNTELQQKEAIKLVEEAVNEILDMQVQSSDDQSTDSAEEKTIEEDKSGKELPRSYSVMSKVIMCKKFIKAMDKMKKSKARVKRNLPQQSEISAENVRLRARRMDDKNCEEWMLDYALQQVIGKLAPTQKKKVSLLVEAFEKVNPPPDTRRNKRFNVVA